MLHELNQDYLYKEYNINKRSAIDIANDINCSPTTINNNLRKYNDDRGYYLSVPKKYYNKFFDIIGECPVDCYKYKWK